VTYNGNTVGVVVPAYNEQGFVGGVIDTMPDFVDRIYVVDDCSTDGTWQEIREHAERANRAAADRHVESPLADGGLAVSPRVVPIRHEENRGVGAAIKTGYRRAYEDGIDVVAVMAGDGQMDPDLLDRLLDPIVKRGADYAKGNRLLHPEFRAAMPPFRLFGNWMLSLLTKIASGYWNTGDPQNGYTAISYRALDRLDVEGLYDDYGFANELLVRLNQQGMQVADVAMPAVYGDEQSTISYRTFVPTVSLLLLRSFVSRLWTQFGEFGDRATVLGYALGTLGLLAAIPVGLLAALHAGRAFGVGLAAALAAVGCLSFGLAALLDRAKHERLEMQVDGGFESEG
jgi:glycosyltransferase involved in cell wall biosynthesis